MRSGKGDAGSISVYLVVFVPVLIFAAGLVFDGGAKIEGLGQARDLADNAARIGVQKNDPFDQARPIKKGDADQAISDYIAGTSSNVVSVTIAYPSPSVIEVEVAVQVDYRILPGSPIVSAVGRADSRQG